MPDRKKEKRFLLLNGQTHSIIVITAHLEHSEVTSQTLGTENGISLNQSDLQVHSQLWHAILVFPIVQSDYKIFVTKSHQLSTHKQSGVYLVGACLSRPTSISDNFTSDFVSMHSSFLHHVVNCLFNSPTLNIICKWLNLYYQQLWN